MIRRCLVLAALTLLPLAAFAAPPSSATEAEGFTVTDEKLKQEKDFGPIVGNNPSTQANDPTLGDCKTLPTSTAVSLTWKIRSNRPTKVSIVLKWEDAGGTNDLDLYLFSDEGDILATSASDAVPETINLGGLENGTYWLCVNNFAGINAGFTIELTAQFLSLYERPPPPPTPIASVPPKVTPTPTPTPEPTEPPPPTPSPEAVATPGPDGPASDQQLVAVSGQRQATPTDEGTSGLRIALFTLTGLIAASGIGIVALRIRRDTTV
jgi:hypothetical protein